jgi:hypothetical protein
MRLPSESAFSSRLRSVAVTARVGLWLGVCFGVAFVTGLLSHYAQEPHQPVLFPAVPAWGYRVTQGVHVVAGTAAVPLLLVKLWSVYPRLFAAIPRRPRELALTGLERGSIAVLVSSAIMQVATGVANAAQWYPWEFSFRRTHYALAWVAIGALLIHIAVKLPVIREALGGDVDETAGDRPSATVPGPVSRRELLRLTWVATGVAVLTSAVGTLPGLGRVSLLAARSRDVPTGIPINVSAHHAGVTATATTDAYRCVVAYAGTEVALTRADLLALAQHTAELPIACVEGWSASGAWTGPRLSDVLALAGAAGGRSVEVVSLQQWGAQSRTTLPANFADDDRTLLALALDGEPLSLDHGYPARLIAPNRPGALQTKWVARLEVQA